MMNRNIRSYRNVQIVNTRNRILSQNIQMTLDTRHTDLNNNIMVIWFGKNIPVCKTAVTADDIFVYCNRPQRGIVPGYVKLYEAEWICCQGAESA